MGDHRGGRRALRGVQETPPPSTPYVGRRVAVGPAETPVVTVAPATTSYAGRRIAGRAVEAPTAQAPAAVRPPAFADSRLTLVAPGPAPTATLVEPAPTAPSEDTRIDTGTINRVLADLEPQDQSTSFETEPTAELPLIKAAPGKRRAVKHAGSRGALFRGLPSPPVLIGIAALAVSVGGAVTATNSDLAGSPTRPFAQASALGGASDVGRVGSGTREKVVTRDSQRTALGDAADAKVVDEAEEVAEQRDSALQELQQKAESRAKVIAKNVWQLPVASGVYHLTARFGQYGLWSSYHTGLDFAAPTGTPINAIANGVVTSASYDGAYGNKTVVTLEDGTELWYCHQNAFGVSVGDTVRGGDLIGYVGSTGHVTGPHVHIEVRPGAGDPVDPFAAFVEHGVTP